METNLLQAILFFTFGAIAVAGAVGVIAAHKLVYSALSLLANFTSLGALYIMLSAEFLGVVQFIVYAGAIVVLFLFALMFVGGNQAAEPVRFRPNIATLIPLGLAALLLAELVYLLLSTNIVGRPGTVTPEVIAEVGNVQLLGSVLFTDYLLPFQLVAVLLLVGVVGAVVLARSRRIA